MQNHCETCKPWSKCRNGNAANVGRSKNGSTERVNETEQMVCNKAKLRQETIFGTAETEQNALLQGKNAKLYVFSPRAHAR